MNTPFATTTRRLAGAALLTLAAGTAQAGLVISDHATGLTPANSYVVGAGQRVIWDFDITAYTGASSWSISIGWGAVAAGQNFQLFVYGDPGATGSGPSFWGLQGGVADPDGDDHSYGANMGSALWNSAIADGLFSVVFVNHSTTDPITLNLLDSALATPAGRVDLFDPAVAAAVPEPGTLALLGVAALGAALARRRRT